MAIWMGLFILVLALPFLLMGFKPEMKWILVALVALAIYNFVRMFTGDSWITIGITAVLFYFLVWKHLNTAIFFWWFLTLVSFGVFSFIGWTYIAVKGILRR